MALPAVIATIAANLLGGVGIEFGKMFTLEAAKFLAWRAFILFIVFVAVPILLYNIAVDLIFDLINYSVAYVSGQNFQPLTVALTGMAGWIGTKLNMPQMFSIYMTAISTRFIMGFIPFLR